MSREIRSLIFFFLLAIFLFGGPAIALWSQGYRFDTQNRRLTRVGGIFVKTEPADVLLHISREQESRLDKGASLTKQVTGSLFYNGVIVKNLLPRAYDVNIIAGPRRFTWSKKLEVEPLGVVRASHVVLIEKEVQGEFFGTASSIAALWPVALPGKLGDDITSVWFQTKNSPILLSLRLDNPALKPEELFNPRTLQRTGSIKNILFSANGRNAIVEYDTNAIIWLPDAQGKTEKARLASKYLAKIAQESGTPVQSFHYVWHPLTPSRFFVVVKNGFYQVDTAQDQQLRITRVPLVGFGIGNAEAFFLTRDGDLFRINANTEPFLITSSHREDFKNFSEEKNGGMWKIREGSNQTFVFTNAEGDAYMLERDRIVPIVRKSDALALSLDGVKLVFAKDGKLWLYTLTRIADDFTLEKRTMVLLQDIGKTPSRLYWLQTHWHLLALFPKEKQTQFLEIDFREPLNSWTLNLDGALDTSFWNPRTKTLWVLAEEKILKWELR